MLFIGRCYVSKPSGPPAPRGENQHERNKISVQFKPLHELGWGLFPGRRARSRPRSGWKIDAARGAAEPISRVSWVGYFRGGLEIQQKPGSSRSTPQSFLRIFVFSSPPPSGGGLDLYSVLLTKCYHNIFGRAREREVGADRAQLTAAFSRIPPFYIHGRLDKHLCE